MALVYRLIYKQRTLIIKGIIHMIKKCLTKVLIGISLFSAVEIIGFQESQAQVFGGDFTNKWLWVGSLRQYFSSSGSEIEYGRRGRSFLNTDQDDGLRWPALYQSQDHNAGKALWIGTTNFADPISNVTYPHKVIPFGRSALYLNSAVYPVEFKLVGRFAAPTVTVDNVSACDLDAYDLDLGGGDQVDPTLPADRMIYNKVNTPIGVTVFRKVYAFAQQYHDNYYIYEYVFKNTGLSDNTGGQITPAKTLTGVVFNFRYRFACNNEGYIGGWTYAGVSWGVNTICDAVGQDPAHTLPAPNDNLRAVYEYYGPHSQAPGISDDIGGPDFQDGHILGGSSFIGETILHADASPSDHTNDLTKYITSVAVPTDGTIEAINPTSPFNAGVMTQQYQSMTIPHEAQTDAQRLGQDANGWPLTVGNNRGTGGYGATQSIGPYTLAPGDSIRIVIAEAVAGINRQKNVEVARNWYTWYQNGRTGTTPLALPDGFTYNGNPMTTTTDGNIYKNAWVFTGKDSLFQSFRRAIANYNSGYNIPKAPPPPDKFTVSSGGDRISLSWSNNADSWPNFNGYQVYRAMTKTDTIYELLTSCDKNNVIHSFDDVTARRGFNYFYYIQTKDDGSTNDIQPGTPLVSSMFYTLTNVAASLRRPASNNLADIRIVPNPYNIKATGIQYGTNRSVADQISFFGLPPFCVIKIFTETGDLIQTIDHKNGSGDEKWNSQTSSNQIVVSGLYIAYFEVTQDTPAFKKGENTFRKFIIIR
jgi:hypothetical protein